MPKPMSKLLRNSVINGIHLAFKLGDTESNKTIETPGFEASYISFASQEAHQLNEYIKYTDSDGPMVYHFAPHGKWSIISTPKIKAQWRDKCQQITDNDGVWNAISGIYRSDGFYPFMLDNDVCICIKLHHSKSGPGVLLVPYQTYRLYTVTPRKYIPDISFKGEKLKCVDPCTYSMISINRQGVYINRKYRHKMDLEKEIQEQKNTHATDYELTIHYKDELVGIWHLNEDFKF